MRLVLSDVEITDAQSKVDGVDVVERRRERGQVGKQEQGRKREQASAHGHWNWLHR
jgi:hypothetical protein